ncbi:ABC transporter substrate-binding protein [Cryobacterium sp. SO2]|uniref:ABC transporter substrate-binding protein n=1 Tax=Cryobacterium sp. SO2 TaxID=1897060 RepID=UPI00223CAF73|nr:ABC transporter substrate-binding protein [Cryobacterium sp. SO2]WEO77850.1 ABC transporter substrate-binding protein [Cryobacterium sp. SO2]
MNRRLSAAGAVGLASLVVLTGCATSSTADTDSAVTDVNFALDWTPNTNHTGLYVAIAEGYFEDAGLNVTVLPYSDSSTDTLINSGAADFGVSFQDTATFAAATGVENTSVFAILQHNPVSIGVLESATDITSPKDLDGKIFGNAGSSETYIKEATDAIVNDGGTGDFTSVTLGTSAYEALYAGQVDFVGAFETWEGIDAELKGTPMKFFHLQDYGVPDIYSVIVDANKDWLAANPEAATAFVGALQKGYQYAADNPDEAAQILIDQNPGAFEDEELVFASQEELSANYLTDADGVVGTQTAEQWQAFADYLFESDLLVDEDGAALTEAPDTSTMFTNEYLSTTE